MLRKPSRPQAKTPRKRRLIDGRLLGRWKSDRRRTFRDVALKRGSPEARRRFMALFGKLIVTWRPTTVIDELNGQIWKGEYEIIAKDELGVVVRTYDDIFTGGDRHWRIEFEEGGYYRVMGGASVIEYFRKLDDPAAPRKTKKRNHGSSGSHG